MRTSKYQRPWHPGPTTLVLSFLLLFLVLSESQARSVSGVETLVSDDKKDGASVTGVQSLPNDRIDSDLSERIKTELPGSGDNVLEEEEKTTERGQVVAVGIRRFDAEEPEGEVPEKGKVDPKGIHIGSETHVEVSEVKVSIVHDQEDGLRRTAVSEGKQGEQPQRARIEEGEISPESKTAGNVQQDPEDLISVGLDSSETQQEDVKVISINTDGLGKLQSGNQKNISATAYRNIEPESEIQNLTEPPYSAIESLKKEAYVLQQQVSDKSLFETVKEPTLVMPGIPILTEADILEAFKSVPSIKEHHQVNIEPLGHHLLSDKQTEIVQCSVASMQQQQRPNFLRGMYDCVRNLSVLNCMRIFVYPIIAETVPQLILQNIPGLPIEINVPDLLPNRNKTKTARSGAFFVYSLLNTEEVFIGMLKDVLDTHRSFESVPSYIDPMNETFVKLLSPGQMNILQMGEKILPVSSRREYSDRMYSCVKRFEYFSCLRYFAWPMIKLYYPALPDFPNYEILYPIPTFTEYPILPFPLEPLPEVIAADLKRRPDALILRILREGIKPGLRPTYYNLSQTNSTEADHNSPTVLLEQMIKNPPFVDKAPFTRPVALHIPQDQLNSLYVAKQILPPQLRAEFSSQSLKCIQEFNYYACMKYYTWPIVRQAQPTLPQFPDLASLFQLPDFSQFFQFPNLAGLFQLPNFPTFAQPSFPNLPFLPQAPSLPTIPSIPGAPMIPFAPEAPTLPSIPGVPAIPSIPGAPMIPPIPGAPTIPPIPGVPTIPPIPEAPIAPTIPPIPGVPSIPSIANIPLIPTASPAVTPATAPTVLIRDAQSIQVNSLTDLKESREGESGHSFPEVESRHNIPKVEFPEGETIESTVSDSRNPQIQISSRKNEISNVPVITITGTQFVPILSEKPETVIYTILRLYQISDPDLTNTLAIPFLNSSTPEFANFLTLHQENIILLAKNMLPETARSSFSEQMISCVRDKDFMICSREVMFPTLSEYFPNLPSFPNFEPPQQPEKQLNSMKLLPHDHQISETNVKTDKHGEATVTITDTRFIPIFSEHPEGVVMNILRAVQISTPNLPPGPLKTREFLARPEFKEILSEKQVGILEVAESLLPEQLRETFIKRMIECNQEEVFLDCTRDIAFPSIAQYFPNLPKFPNFGNQLSISNRRPADKNVPASFQLLRDGFYHQGIEANEYLQQIENHLQNEIENILIRAVSVNERSKTPDDDDDHHSSYPVAYGLLSKQQRNIMRLSDDILPKSVRPAYHARMVNCIQSNSFVTCMQNVGWPILRLNPLLLNSPARIIPEYTPQASVPIPNSPIVIPHVEFNYENLGQSAAQPGRSTSDITSSVGEHNTNLNI